jgi:predicted DNA-binding protein
MEAEYKKGYVYPFKLTEESQSDLTKITNKLGCTKAEAIRDALRHYAEYLEGLEVVSLRDVSEEDAKEEVRAYLKGKERVRADEISDALRLDLSLVNDVLTKLWREGEVEPL